MEKLSIKAIRVNLDKTQDEMANLLNITPRAYADRENGKSRWFFDEILTIAKFANIEIDKIKGWFYFFIRNVVENDDRNIAANRSSK